MNTMSLSRSRARLARLKSSNCFSAAPSPLIQRAVAKGEPQALKQFEDFNRANLARDRDNDMVFMAKSPWDVGYQQEKNPDLTFSATKER